MAMQFSLFCDRSSIWMTGVLLTPMHSWQMHVCVSMSDDAEALTFCSSEPPLLHFKHALDDERRPDSLQNETDGKGKGGGHAKDLYDQASIKEGFDDPRHQQKPSCNPAHPLEDLQAESTKTQMTTLAMLQKL